MKTSTFLSLSLTANLLLASLAFYLINSRQDTALPLALNPAPPEEELSNPLHESQSDDYPTRIAKVRSAGSPDAAIGEIASDTLRATYNQKRRNLEARFAAQANREALPAALRQLEQEEADLRSKLLSSASLRTGSQSNPVAADASTSPPPALIPVSSTRRAALTARIPFAFEANPQTSHLASVPQSNSASRATEALILTPLQQEAVNQLRESFLKEIGGENQNPNDPAYLERWVQAQPVLDERLRAELGTDLFNQFQINTYRPE